MGPSSIEAFSRKNRSDSPLRLAGPHVSVFWNLRADFGSFSHYENSLVLSSHLTAVKTSGDQISPAIHRESLSRM